LQGLSVGAANPVRWNIKEVSRCSPTFIHNCSNETGLECDRLAIDLAMILDIRSSLDPSFIELLIRKVYQQGKDRFQRCQVEQWWMICPRSMF